MGALLMNADPTYVAYAPSELNRSDMPNYMWKADGQVLGSALPLIMVYLRTMMYGFSIASGRGAAGCFSPTLSHCTPTQWGSSGQEMDHPP